MSNHEKFMEFCNRVELIEDPLIADSEIALALNSSETRVKRARRRLRDEEKAVERTPKDISSANARRFAKLKLQIKSIGLEETIDTTAEKTGATRQQVLHQRQVLFESGELEKRTREKTKRKLKRILNRHLKNNPLTPVNLSEIFRTSGLGVSWSTIQSLYHEIAKEQIVPGISFNSGLRKRKH
jgi:hypothetical protein